MDPYAHSADVAAATLDLRQSRPAPLLDANQRGCLAEEALALFVEWLGRFAGDMALAFGARGGVYLGGGIAPKIIPALEMDGFRKAFEAKGRLSSFLKTVPVHVIKATDAGLRGAAIALSEAIPAVATGQG